MIAQTLAEALSSQQLTLAVAESCTGGLVSKTITDLPGSSRYFLVSCVTYSNAAKMSLLGVKEKTLIDHGAVSLETAAEMAQGVRKVAAADIGISTTGIAGPDGGSDFKPVGTVCFAVSYQDTIVTKKEIFEGDRNAIREQATEYILRLLLKVIS
ncbi:CinA family protein [Candidatus Methanomassiliicoccus intestinalis]|uniref:CinA family protein n=1 Tax=Candidatus Methanomassiliicoccus intestinalis TaxID=1406512 RepID=UPI0037DDC600